MLTINDASMIATRNRTQRPLPIVAVRGTHLQEPMPAAALRRRVKNIEQSYGPDTPNLLLARGYWPSTEARKAATTGLRAATMDHTQRNSDIVLQSLRFLNTTPAMPECASMDGTMATPMPRETSATTDSQWRNSCCTRGGPEP